MIERRYPSLELFVEGLFTPVALGGPNAPTPFTAAGVVTDVRFDNRRRDAGALAYPPVRIADQTSDLSLVTFVMRT